MKRVGGGSAVGLVTVQVDHQVPQTPLQRSERLSSGGSDFPGLTPPPADDSGSLAVAGVRRRARSLWRRLETR